MQLEQITKATNQCGRIRYIGNHHHIRDALPCGQFLYDSVLQICIEIRKTYHHLKSSLIVVIQIVANLFVILIQGCCDGCGIPFDS